MSHAAAPRRRGGGEKDGWDNENLDPMTDAMLSLGEALGLDDEEEP